MAATENLRGVPPGLQAAVSALVLLASLPVLRELEWPIIAFLGAVFALRGLSLYRPRLTPTRWLLVPLTLAGVVNVLAVYLSVFGRAGIALLLTMSALKLLELRKNRDARLGILLVFAIALANFLVDQSLAIAGYLLVLGIAGIAVLIELERGSSGRRWRESSGLALRLFAQAAPLAGIFFFLFPRLDAPLWQFETGERAAKTGMSDTMELGSVSRLIPSDAVAFRARFDERPPDPARSYWRGPVLWKTDGRRWEPSGPAASPVSPPVPTPPGDEVGYEVTLEPTDQRWLFALDLPVEIPEDAMLTPDFQVLTAKPVRERRRYHMVSAPDFRSRRLSAEDEQMGLQVPGDVSPRMRELVASWKQDGAKPEVVVRKAIEFFRDQPFYYSLSPPPLGEDPIDEFLFESRRGYCEHFASSFAVLMRLAGIPSRIVLGYLGGERNPLGDYFVVRQSDAHAWTEVWLPDEGWTRVDPTAAIPPNRIERSPALDWLTREAPIRLRLSDAPATWRSAIRYLSLLADSVDAAWQSWVLSYSIEKQRQLLNRLGLGFVRDYGLVLVLVLAGGSALAVMMTALRWRPQRERDPAQRLFVRFCRVLERNGVPRRRGEGPLAYAERAADLRPDLQPDIARVVVGYLPLRYGRKTDEGRLEMLRSGLRNLRRRLRRSAATSP